MKFIISIFTLVLFTTGCVSRISQPVASRPLVENVIAYASESVPQVHWSALSQNQSGTTIHISGTALVMGERYSAASGDTCVKLHIQTGKENGSKTVCKAKDGLEWHFAKPVIAYHSESIEAGQ